MKAISLFFLLALAACAAPQEQPAACQSHQDCTTPEEYFLRSSCPYTSVCVEGACKVACPQFLTPDPNHPENTTNYTSPLAMCMTDSDCSCDRFRSEGDCRCIDGSCYAVIES